MSAKRRKGAGFPAPFPKTLARRVEPDGEESMPLEAFSALFARGGRAMIAQGA